MKASQSILSIILWMIPPLTLWIFLHFLSARPMSFVHLVLLKLKICINVLLCSATINKTESDEKEITWENFSLSAYDKCAKNKMLKWTVLYVRAINKCDNKIQRQKRAKRSNSPYKMNEKQKQKSSSPFRTFWDRLSSPFRT